MQYIYIEINPSRAPTFGIDTLFLSPLEHLKEHRSLPMRIVRRVPPFAMGMIPLRTVILLCFLAQLVPLFGIRVEIHRILEILARES